MSKESEGVSTSWHSYPKVWSLGHAAIKDIFTDPVIVEEKVDGSQFSFGVFKGEVRVRSKGAVLNLIAPEKMFIAAIETVKKLAELNLLREGWTYRCEYLMRPKHNTLCYERIPEQHLIGYDINTGHEEYLPYETKRAYFADLGLETVPKIYEGVVQNVEMFRPLLDTISCLGKQKVEGVVVKNYKKFTPDGKAMLGKFVSEEFKEIHNGEWRERNPGKNDVLLSLINDYSTPARWGKSLQHLKEQGKLEGSPKDIGLLMKSVGLDVREECEQEIKDKLFEWAWGHVQRGVTRGLPQWYKEQLLASSFSEEA